MGTSMIEAKITLFAVGCAVFDDIIALAKGTEQRKGNHLMKKESVELSKRVTIL